MFLALEPSSGILLLCPIVHSEKSQRDPVGSNGHESQPFWLRKTKRLFPHPVYAAIVSLATFAIAVLFREWRSVSRALGQSRGSHCFPHATCRSMVAPCFGVWGRLMLDVWSCAESKLTMSSFFLSSCLLYTSPSPRDRTRSRMPSSA